MEVLAAVDEVALETQRSEGWTYAIFPLASVNAMDAAVKNCRVERFHGKRSKKSEAADYRVLLTAARRELERGGCRRPIVYAAGLVLEDQVRPVRQKNNLRCNESGRRD
jgi:hypothetical protein